MCFKISHALFRSLLLPGESVVFNTTITPSGPKRRASRLLAMAVAPKKIKTRDLVLTTHRLICLKEKPGRGVLVRTELFVQPCERDKDGRNTITSIEPKGELEFVVMTVNFSAHLARCLSYAHCLFFPASEVALFSCCQPHDSEHLDS